MIKTDPTWPFGRHPHPIPVEAPAPLPPAPY
jgi:hypothetical protein